MRKKTFDDSRPGMCRSQVPVVFALLLAATLRPGALLAERIPVRHMEGATHGFLVLRTEGGEMIADGDLAQEVHGSRVESRLTFHFADGSLYEDRTEFSQHRQFRLLRDTVVQKGPSFKHQNTVSLDTTRGTVSVVYQEDGKEKKVHKKIKLPADLANGMVFTLLKNILPQTAETTVSYLVATPDPRIVKLKVTPEGEERFSVGHTDYRATHYLVKVDIGGITGVVATLIGKQPPDLNIWILKSEVPAFIRFFGPLDEGGPEWIIELASPNWPKRKSD